MGKASFFCKQFHLKSGVKEQGAIKSLTRVEQDYLLSNRGGDEPELSSEAIKQIDTIMKLGLKTCSPFRQPPAHSLAPAVKVAASTQPHFKTAGTLKEWLESTFVFDYDKFEIMSQATFNFYMTSRLSDAVNAHNGESRMWNIYKDASKLFFIQLSQMLTYISPAYTLLSLQPSLTKGTHICSLSSLDNGSMKSNWFGMTAKR